LAHEDVHEGGRRSDDARQPLRAAGAGNETKLRLGESDQVVPIFGDTKIARERELEGAGQGRAGNGGDYRFWHALAQRHGLVEESAIVGGILWPLTAGSAQGLGDFDERWDAKVTIKITRRAAGYDDNANVEIARKSLQHLGQRVAHLLVEINARCASQGDDCNSIGYSRRQNIVLHGGFRLNSL